jgi:hypothetical protein
MTFETEHESIFQNIELEIVTYYHQQPELIDAEVLTAIEWVNRIYTAEVQGKTITLRPIRGLSAEVANRVKDKCDLLINLSDNIGDFQSATPAVIAECLKRLQSSIKFWNKQHGRQGYLNYIVQFFPA